MVARSRARAVVVVAIAAVAVVAACGGTGIDNAALSAAARDSRAQEVTVQGRVGEVLADGHGPHGVHQRFDVDVDGLSVEIDHNLELAPRVPVTSGDTVMIHGQFEPDPGRPLIHDTHHATGRHEGGWIELAGHRYE